MRLVSLLVGSLGLAAAKNYTGPAHCVGECQRGPIASKMSKVMKLKEMNIQYQEAIGQAHYHGASIKGAATPCVDGMAGEYPCDNVDMLAFINYADLGSSTGRGNDIWGWTSRDGTEYAIMCATDGTSFVDISDPVNPAVVAWLPGNGAASTWRDAKVHNGIVYIISEATNAGLQYYDMNHLDSIPRAGTPQTVTGVVYTEFGSCHNIVLNEATGFAYGVGSRTCAGGLHVVDLNGAAPAFSGCFDNDGYTHDAQCVIYNGADTRYAGHEICFNYNEDSLTIVDVTDKNNMDMLSRVVYDGYAYSHQGWLTENQNYLLLDDELDESRNTNGEDGFTVSYVWDVRSLTNPVVMGRHRSSVQAIDHNMYIQGDLCFQANYEAGVRIIDVSDVANYDSTMHSMPEVAFFDVRPQSQSVAFNGAWSVYNFFDSEVFVVSSIERGLFVLKMHEDRKFYTK